MLITIRSTILILMFYNILSWHILYLMYLFLVIEVMMIFMTYRSYWFIVKVYSWLKWRRLYNIRMGSFTMYDWWIMTNFHWIFFEVSLKNWLLHLRLILKYPMFYNARLLRNPLLNGMIMWKFRLIFIVMKLIDVIWKNGNKFCLWILWINS